MIANDRKKAYLDTGAFKENSDAFVIGSQMAFEMEQDYRVMKFTHYQLRIYFDKIRLKRELTIEESVLANCIDMLQSRINLLPDVPDQ